MRDLGEHLLKDLERPERIYQVVAEGLAEDFPPIKTVTEIARRSEVPTGTVSFVSTDMVGFRRLLRMGTDHYAAVMEEHDRLLRSAFERAVTWWTWLPTRFLLPSDDPKMLFMPPPLLSKHLDRATGPAVDSQK